MLGPLWGHVSAHHVLHGLHDELHKCDKLKTHRAVRSSASTTHHLNCIEAFLTLPLCQDFLAPNHCASHLALISAALMLKSLVGRQECHGGRQSLLRAC